MNVAWHSLAQADLVDLLTFIANENPTAAMRIHEAIRHQIGLLQNHPHLGRPGRVTGTRELAINGTPFIAVYQVTDAVLILRMLHGAQRWPPHKDL